MATLFAALKAHRRAIAPLIPLSVAAWDYCAGSGDLVRPLLVSALVTAVVYLPARYFRYQPRVKR